MLALRVVLSLAIVLGLLVFATRFVRGGGILGARRTGGPLAILARQGLNRSGSIVVVRAGERALVLGVTEQQVALLCDLDPAVFEQDTELSARTPSPAGPISRNWAWRDAVDALRDRTVRRH